MFLLCGETPQFSTVLQSKTANSVLQKKPTVGALEQGLRQ